MNPSPTNSELIRVISESASPEESIADLAVRWAELTNAVSCDIFYREQGDTLVLKASTAYPEMTGRMKLGPGVGLCGLVLQQGQPVFVEENAAKHPKYAHYPGLGTDETLANIILPLKQTDGWVFGVVQLQLPAPISLSEADRVAAMHAAELVALSLRTYEQAYLRGTRYNRLGALSEVSKTISNSPYLEEILQLLVNLTAQQFDYRVCTVRLLDEDRNELVLRATQAHDKAYQKKRAIKLGESMAGKAIAENRTIVVRDVQNDPDYIGHDLAAEQGLRSMICVPLMVQDQPVGVLTCYTSESREFPPDEIKALETLAKQAAVSIAHARLQVRNTLMQEMHHRVKNNLQQVASLLRLQMRHGSYKTLNEALNDCLNRILAIASVHDLLSREDLDHVGIRSIAESLVHHQQSSLILPDRSILFLVRGDDPILNMTQATQLALVLNELISNAVEHGFEHTLKGEIHVTVEDKEGEISVWVSNSGDRLPEDFEPSKYSHLGLQIVDSLAKAMGGRFRLSDVLGWTVAEVKFARASNE